MPTLDDAPTIEKLTGLTDLSNEDSTAADELALSDVLQVYDVSEQKAKTITVREFMGGIGLIPAS
jgi:hypothetical protein